MTDDAQGPADLPQGDGPELRTLLRLGLVAVLIGGVAYTVLLSLGDLGDSIRALADISIPAVAGAIGLEALAVLALGAVYRASSVGVSDPLAYRAALNTSMSTFTVTQVVPAGGAVAVGLAVRRMIGWGMGRAAAVGAAALSTTVPLLVLVLLATGGVISAVADGTLASPLLAASAVVLSLVLLALVGLVVWVLRAPGVGERLIDRIGRLVTWLTRGHVVADLTSWRASIADMTETPPTLAALGPVAGWAIARWALEIGVLWLLFEGLGETLPIGLVVVGLSVQHLAVMIPITPGGLGLVEAGMSGAFIAMGTPADIAIPAVLAFRLVSYWLPLLAGLRQYLLPPGRPAAAPELPEGQPIERITP